MQLALAQIRIDGGTQPRAKIDENLVADYAQAMRDGATFPPVVVFHDGVDHWLADGFHRFHAARKNGDESIAADICTGTLRDAILYSVSANAAHGLRRTNEDKRRAVMTLLNDAEWSQWSDREIARRCGVHWDMVSNHRPKPSLSDSDSERVYTTRHGTQAKMKTERIGIKDALGRKQNLREGFAPVEQRVVQLQELAAQGFRVDQAAERMGVSEGYARDLANTHGVQFAAATKNSPRVNYRRAIEQTVLSLEASAASVRTIGVSLEGIEKETVADWAKSIGESLRVFNALRKKLQEHANA